VTGVVGKFCGRFGEMAQHWSYEITV